MKKHITKVDLTKLGIIFILFVVIGWTAWDIFGPQSLVIIFSFTVCLMACLILEMYRRFTDSVNKITGRIKWEIKNAYNQSEALFNIFSVLKPKYPLPKMRDWAVSPDFVNIVIGVVNEIKPGFVLECGSGVSTVTVAYALQHIGTGQICSLEHDEKYCEITHKNLKTHHLDETGRVIHAPLIETPLKGKSWMWYDLKELADMPDIDLLIIDGPPGSVQPLSRYPALPKLMAKLSRSAVIVLDDASRNDEKEIVKQWLEEFQDFQYEWKDTETGAVILRRHHSELVADRNSHTMDALSTK